MKPNYLLLIVYIGLIIFLTGCSSNSTGIITPFDPESSQPENIYNGSGNDHSLLGSYEMKFDLDNLTATIEPNRENAFHFSIRSFLPSPGIVVNSFNPGTQIVDVDVTINNTFAINGYDVRLIIFTDAIGHELINSDNWTGLFDIPGGSDINPFKAYAKTEPARVFRGLEQHTENLLIRLPGGNPNVQFAIDASYPANCEEPYDIYDFQHGPFYDELNHVTDASVMVSRWDIGTSVTLELDCVEIFGSVTPELGSLDSELFTGTIRNREQAPAGQYNCILRALGSASPLYLYDVVPITVTQRPVTGWAVQFDDDFPIGVEADSEENVYSLASTTSIAPLNIPTLRKQSIEGTPVWERDLKSQDLYNTVNDMDLSPYNDFAYIAGARAFCGTQNDDDGIRIAQFTIDNQRPWLNSKCVPFRDYYGTATLGDNSGNCYVGGNLDSSFSTDICALWKLDSDGTEDWYLEFANDEGNIEINDMAFHSRMGSFSAVGSFSGSLDFDPSGGYIHRTSYGDSDGYITKWSSSGSNLMTLTFGDSTGSGEAATVSKALAIDSQGNIFVVGRFSDSVDFDPERSGVSKSSAGSTDAFVVKFDSSGNIIRVIRIGSSGIDGCTSIAIDSNDDIYVTGYFEDTVNFNPNPPFQANKTSEGYLDCYLAKYSNDFIYKWVRTWGDNQRDEGVDIEISPTNEFVLLIGAFAGTIDFDPGTRIHELSTGGANNRSTFVMKLFPNGLWEP